MIQAFVVLARAVSWVRPSDTLPSPRQYAGLTAQPACFAQTAL